MFSETMMPISTIVPIAMAMPASDMMFAPTPTKCIAMNDINTAAGRQMATTMLLRMCRRKSRMMMAVMMISSRNACVNVAIVSSIKPLRS